VQRKGKYERGGGGEGGKRERERERKKEKEREREREKRREGKGGGDPSRTEFFPSSTASAYESIRIATKTFKRTMIQIKTQEIK
jgi:hypothetical protein